MTTPPRGLDPPQADPPVPAGREPVRIDVRVLEALAAMWEGQAVAEFDPGYARGLAYCARALVIELRRWGAVPSAPPRIDLDSLNRRLAAVAVCVPPWDIPPVALANGIGHIDLPAGIGPTVVSIEVYDPDTDEPVAHLALKRSPKPGSRINIDLGEALG